MNYKKLYKEKAKSKKFSKSYSNAFYPNHSTYKDIYDCGILFRELKPLSKDHECYESLEKLIDNFGIESGIKRKKYRELRAIINLCILSLHIQMPFSIPISAAKFYKTEWLGKINMSYRNMKKAVEYLVAMDYLDIAKGFWLADSKHTRISMFTVTPKLAKLLIQVYKINLSNVSFSIVQTVSDKKRNPVQVKKIINKKKDKKLIDYDLSSEIAQSLIKQSELYTELMSQFDYTLKIPYKELLTLTREQLISFYNIIIGFTVGDNKLHNIEMIKLATVDNINNFVWDTLDYHIKQHTLKELQKIQINTLSHVELQNEILNIEFTKPFITFSYVVELKETEVNWDHNGRIYTILQDIPSSLRKYLFLDGNETIEIDYNGIHPSILYAFKGLEAPDNIYYYNKGDIRREQAKLITLICFNADTYKEGYRAIVRKFKEVGYKTNYIRSMIKDLINYHEPIKEYFFSGIGRRLMNLDSQMAKIVIEHFLNQNVPIIPIHDSFVVPVDYSVELDQIMKKAFMDVLNIDIIPKTDFDKKEMIWIEMMID